MTENELIRSSSVRTAGDGQGGITPFQPELTIQPPGSDATYDSGTSDTTGSGGAGGERVQIPVGDGSWPRSARLHIDTAIAGPGSGGPRRG